MCKHCEKSESFVNYDDGFRQVNIDIYHNIMDVGVQTEDDGFRVEVEIKYCPICGRELKGEK